jgi:hypothetical protein
MFAAGTDRSGQGTVPFKLGTFDQNGRTFVGVVLKDAFVMDLAQASAALKSPASKVPGDVLATGSPAGVGSARKPPIFFKAGDVSACTYDGMGTLTNPIVAPRPPGIQ